MGSEDEEAFMQVTEEDEESNNVGQFLEEAMAAIRRQKVYLEFLQEERAAVAEVTENPEEQTDLINSVLCFPVCFLW